MGLFPAPPPPGCHSWPHLLTKGHCSCVCVLQKGASPQGCTFQGPVPSPPLLSSSPCRSRCCKGFPQLLAPES